jgi:flagellar protein FlaI
MDGSLPDGSRVQVTYGTDIAMRGSNFTIRKFTEKPITPIDELNFGTVSPEINAYLWMTVESGLSLLVAGSTATGKTSFLNAMSLFIQPELKIISIEDTPELRLPHPNWIPVVARAGFGIKGYGEVTMFDLLKSALRQRPNFVIVGEVRGKEAYVMFPGMATGHPSMGTLPR